MTAVAGAASAPASGEGRMLTAAARGMWLAAGLAFALGGCAIDAYRSVRGLDKDDPNPATAPFSKNLAAGEAANYPNLSTVPPPPTRASTVAERAELTKTLLAQRTSTEAVAAPLQAAAPTPPATASLRGAAKAGAQSPAQPAPMAVASAAMPTPVPSTGVSPLPPIAASTTASVTPAPDKSAAATAAQPSSRSRGRQPAEAPPQESSLQMPVIPSVPEPEATRPPPPAPQLGPAPAVAAVELPKAASAAEMPAPPPAAPVIAPPPPAIPVAPAPKPQPQSLAAFTLSDPPGLDADQRARLDRVAAAYRDKPGTVKILAYAVPAAGNPDQLGSYRAALDRAQFVAAALAQAGVPSNKIQTEASPAGAGVAPGRVEVRLAP